MDRNKFDRDKKATSRDLIMLKCMRTIKEFHQIIENVTALLSNKALVLLTVWLV